MPGISNDGEVTQQDVNEICVDALTRHQVQEPDPRQAQVKDR